MHKGVWCKNIFCNEKLDKFFDISFDIFKEFSGVIFCVHLILPNVADCYLKDLLKPSFVLSAGLNLGGEERAGCINLTIFLMSCDSQCSMTLPNGFIGQSALCD